MTHYCLLELERNTGQPAHQEMLQSLIVWLRAAEDDPHHPLRPVLLKLEAVGYHRGMDLVQRMPAPSGRQCPRDGQKKTCRWSDNLNIFPLQEAEQMSSKNEKLAG